MCDPQPACPDETEYIRGALGRLAAPLAFDSDPDIAGIGVVLSFLIYALVTSGLAGYAYFFAAGVVSDGLYNNLDRLMQAKAQRVLEVATRRVVAPSFGLLPGPVRARARSFWDEHVRGSRRERLQAICLQLADTQLVTGASILVALYSKHCTLTQYHFQVGLGAATLSLVAFQAIFIAVVDILHQSLLMRAWRYAWILALFVANLAGTAVQYSDYFLIDGLYGVPVQCALDKMGSDGYYTSSEATLLGIECLVLVWSLWNITVLLFPHASEIPPFAQTSSLVYWALSWPSRLRLRQGGKASLGKRAFLGALFVVAISVREVLFSTSFDLLRVYAMLVSGAYGIFRDRQRAGGQGRKGDENAWGFGQILPLLLLALPAASLAEEIWRKRDEDGGAETATTTPDTGHVASGRPTAMGSPGRTQSSYRQESRVDKVVGPTLKAFRRAMAYHSWRFAGEEARREPHGGAESLEMIDQLQKQVAALEKNSFDDGVFQAWLVFLMVCLYAISTYVVIVVGVAL